MFSSISLIQLAFINPHDTYYCDSLLKLDYSQFLWLNLHEKFDAVYFLTAKENNSPPNAAIYGDKKANPCTYHQRGFQGFVNRIHGNNHINRFRNWMKEQLRTERCAMVWNLEDFCRFFSEQPWCDDLHDIARIEGRRGTIILTVSPFVEKSRSLLLSSGVFDALSESVILNARKDLQHNYYAALKNGKGESCVFLNAFTKERVHAMLMHVVFEFSDRFHSVEELDVMSQYLTQYLNNRKLQWTDELFEHDFNIINPMYCEIYQQLLKKNVWDRLVKTSRKVSESGGVSSYICQKNIEFVDEGKAAVRIAYENGSYAWRCMQLAPISSNKTNADMLFTIYQELSSPRNREVNSHVTDAIEKLLTKLHNAQCRRDDGTYQRVLYALQYCVQCLYISSENEDAVRKNIDSLNTYVDLSSNLYYMGKQQHTDNTIILQQGTKMQQAKYERTKMLLDKFDMIIHTTISGFSLNNLSLERIAENMNVMIDELEHSSQEESVAAEKPEAHESDSDSVPTSVESSDEDFQFEINDSVFNFKPPS